MPPQAEIFPPPTPPAHPPLGGPRSHKIGAFSHARRWLAHSGPEYRVGTLTYTRAGLFVIFIWLLWGDLVWSLMQAVFPASMPLQLDRLGVPMEWVGYMMGTAAAVINMTFVPVISFRSDRTRTRWGRRIPYIVATMPFLCIFLALLGFSDSIGAWIRASTLPATLHLSATATIVIVMGVLIVLYDVFNVFVNSIYWYLFRDIVPSAFLGRFMAAFRMVGTLAAMIWNEYVYGHVETHTRSIYVGAALLYFFGFGLMCLTVREGQYPPPQDYIKGEPLLQKIWHAICTYARECFTHPLFVTFYISQALLWMASATVIYRQYFFIRHLGFTPKAMGHITAIMGPLILAAQLPMGWLVDKFHPMRVYLIATTASIPMLFAGYFLGSYSIAGYALNAFTLWVIWSAIQMPFLQLREASEVPLMMRLFPIKQFGQFSSANAMLRHFSMIVGSIAGATYMGWANRKYGQFGNAYAFLWHGLFHTLGLMLLWIVYMYWRRYGGEKFRFDPEEETRLKAC